MKRKFNKGDICVLSDTDNFNLAEDIMAKVGDFFEQYGGVFRITGMTSFCLLVEEIN